MELGARGHASFPMTEFKPSVRAVLFDAVGTLLVPDPPVAVAYQRTAAQLGCHADVDEIQRRFRVAFAGWERDDQLLYGYRTSEEHERRRWRDIVESVFPDSERHEELLAALWQHFALPEHWRPCPGAANMIADARLCGRVVGIASNFDARLRDVCRGHVALAGIDHIFISSEIGHRKPHPEFFRAIERALGLEPRELLLIGDDRRNDYQAAVSAGWHAELRACESM